jgi:hypothetical protein
MRRLRLWLFATAHRRRSVSLKAFSQKNRGDRRWTFPNQISESSMFLHVIAQKLEFTEDTFTASA